MIRQGWLIVYFLGSVLASATDTETRRVDALIHEQDKDKSRKLPPSQTFVLGNTELRVDDNKDSSATAAARPSTTSQATVTLRQPIHENLALSLSNEFGSQKSDSLPYSRNENDYNLNRKEIWAVDWTRSGWNGKAYTETQGAGDNQQLLSNQQTAQGVRTGTQLPFGTDLSVEMRQESNLQADTVAAERSIYQTQLSQKLGSLPLTIEVTPGVERESNSAGENISHSSRINNSLRWQATPETRLVLGTGLNSKDYFDAAREESLLYYSQFDTTLKKDLTFSLRSDFQDLTRNNTGISSYQEQRVNFQIGPRLRLPENFTAAFDMRYGYTQDNTGSSSSSGQSEQAVALSIQGRF